MSEGLALVKVRRRASEWVCGASVGVGLVVVGLVRGAFRVAMGRCEVDWGGMGRVVGFVRGLGRVGRRVVECIDFVVVRGGVVGGDVGGVERWFG